MSSKAHPLARLAWMLLVWFATFPPVRKWVGTRPTRYAALRRRRQMLWEYAQADLQPWDTEPDKGPLAEAFALSDSDQQAAFSQLFALAQAGSPIAANAIGESYYWGRGVPRDEVRGEEWFKRAFELGSHRGLLNYGKALFSRKDLGAAEAVFSSGADDDFGPAMCWLSRTKLQQDKSLENFRRTVPYLERAAELGSPEAAGILGHIMSVGFLGLNRVHEGARLVSELHSRMDEPPPRDWAQPEPPA